MRDNPPHSPHRYRAFALRVALDETQRRQGLRPPLPPIRVETVHAILAGGTGLGTRGTERRAAEVYAADPARAIGTLREYLGRIRRAAIRREILSRWGDALERAAGADASGLPGGR